MLTRWAPALTSPAVPSINEAVASGPRWLVVSDTPSAIVQPPTGMLELAIDRMTTAMNVGVIPGWLMLTALALLPAVVTLATWLAWQRMIATDPEERAGNRLAWKLRLTRRERAAADRLAQAARSTIVSVLMVQETFDRGLAQLSSAASNDRHLRAQYESLGSLRARLFGKPAEPLRPAQARTAQAANAQQDRTPRSQSSRSKAGQRRPAPLPTAASTAKGPAQRPASALTPTVMPGTLSSTGLGNPGGLGRRLASNAIN